MKVKISVLKTVPACFAKDRISAKDIMGWNVYPGFRKPCADFTRGLDEKHVQLPGMFYSEIREMKVSLN